MSTVLDDQRTVHEALACLPSRSLRWRGVADREEANALARCPLERLCLAGDVTDRAVAALLPERPVPT